ncbi:MAG: AEC family transporter [Erysipelotrichaceae bacterium]
MEMFIKMMNLQIELLILMLIGFGVKKLKVIDSNQQKGLSELLINVILPATIIKSFISQQNTSLEVFKTSAVMMLVCLTIQIVIMLAAPLLQKFFDKDKAKIMEYGLLVSNSSFVGLPVIEYMFGSQAVMYASIYLIPMRFSMWTVGISLFSDEIDFKSNIKKVIFHPCILAVVLGFILMFLPFSLPTVLSDTISIISRSSSCLSMIVIGAILADINFEHLLDKSILTFTLLRLVILPIMVYMILKLCKLDDLLIAIAVILTAMPCGSTCPILAQKYNSDYKFAAKLILVSSLLSVVSIPLICLILK